MPLRKVRNKTCPSVFHIQSHTLRSADDARCVYTVADCVKGCVGVKTLATNLALDDALINEAVSVGKHPTKKAAVTAALEAYIRHHRQKQIIELFGTIDYDPDFDYKAQRQRS